MSESDEVTQESNDVDVDKQTFYTTAAASEFLSNGGLAKLLKGTGEKYINLKIDDYIIASDAHMPELFSDEYVNAVIVFKSLISEQRIFYVKNDKLKNFARVELFDMESPVVDYFENFLVANLVRLQIRDVCVALNLKCLSVWDLADSQGYNLLMTAIKEGNDSVFDELFKLSFDVNQKSNDGKTAAELAWERRNMRMLLSLLKANSLYPSSLSLDAVEGQEAALEEIKEMIADTESLHGAIGQGNEQEALIKNLKTKWPTLRYFYDKGNRSAATKAIEQKDTSAYMQLTESGCCIGPKEDVNQVLAKLVENTQKDLRNYHAGHARILDRSYLAIHYSKSMIAHDNQSDGVYMKLITNAFDVLSSISEVGPILQITATDKHLQCYFDFNRSSIQYMDPFRGDPKTSGAAYFAGHIYIASKDMLNTKTITRSYGLIFHEHNHLAMFLVFRNGGKPYPADDADREREFRAIIDTCFMLRVRIQSDEIVNSVFDCYNEDEWPAELIVRVPHMIATYHNSHKLNQLRRTYAELFAYFMDYVVPKMVEALPVLQKLANDAYTVKYDDLTDILQKSLKIEIQKKAFPLVNAVSDQAVLTQLSNEALRSMLVHRQRMVIEDFEEMDDKFYVDRDLRMQGSDEKTNFVSVQKEDYMIISDEAGAGKTTLLRRLPRILDSEDNEKWIIFIDLKRHCSHYEKFQKNPRESVVNMLWKMCETYRPDDKLKFEIFQKFFVESQITFLMDGVDEVSPTYTNLFVEVMRKVKATTNNQLWIGTRPQHAAELRAALDINVYSLEPFDHKQRETFVKTVLTRKGVAEEDLADSLELIKKFIADIKQVQNPLMLELITELFVDDREKFSFSELYSFYSDIFDSKKKIVIKEKGVVVLAAMLQELKMTFEEVHEVYALTLLFEKAEDYFIERKSEEEPAMIDISKLKIVRKWKKHSRHWSSGRITNLGILTLDSRNPENEFPMFVHRTFAEYFAVKYLIGNIHELDDDDDDVSDEEMSLRMKLLMYVLNRRESSQDQDIVCVFIRSYMKNHIRSMFHKKIGEFFELPVVRKFLAKQTTDHLSQNSRTKKITPIILNIMSFFNCNREILSSLFKSDNDFSFFQHFLVKCKRFNTILDIYQYLFRVFNHEWFKCSGYALRDESQREKIAKLVYPIDYLPNLDMQYELNEKFQDRYFKACFGLISSVECLDIPLNILDKFMPSILNFAFRSKALSEKLFSVFSAFSTSNEVMEMMLRALPCTLFHNYSSCSNFPKWYAVYWSYFWQKLKEFLKPKEDLKKVLLVDCKEKPLLLALRFDIEFIVNLYLELCSLEEIQTILICELECLLEQLEYVEKPEIIQKFEKFVTKVFLSSNNESDKSQLRTLLTTKFERLFRCKAGETTRTYAFTALSYLSNALDEYEGVECHYDIMKQLKDVFESLATQVGMTSDEISELALNDSTLTWHHPFLVATKYLDKFIFMEHKHAMRTRKYSEYLMAHNEGFPKDDMSSVQAYFLGAGLNHSITDTKLIKYTAYVEHSIRNSLHLVNKMMHFEDDQGKETDAQ